MRKIISMLCIIACLATTIFSACSSTSEIQRGEPIKHEYKDYVYSDFARKMFGEDVEETFKAYSQAIMKGETEFYCKYHASDTITILKELSAEFLPFAVPRAYSVDRDIQDQHEKKTTMPYVIITKISPDHIATIDYGRTKKEFMKEVTEFKEEVTSILDENCKGGYSDLDNALALYDYFVRNMTYTRVTSSYDAIMYQTGVCQDFSSAYDFLLLQLGINAISCEGGLHLWSLVELDGKYYHIDPTFGMEHNDRPVSLAFFGMTDARRIEGEDLQAVKLEFTYSFAAIPDKNGDFKSDDDRFLAFADITDYELDIENKKITYVSASTGKKCELDYSDI